MIAIIANVYPHLPRDDKVSKKVETSNITIIYNKDEGLMLGVLINQFIIFIVGKYRVYTKNYYYFPFYICSYYAAAICITGAEREDVILFVLN